MALRARKLSRAFKKRAPGHSNGWHKVTLPFNGCELCLTALSVKAFCSNGMMLTANGYGLTANAFPLPSNVLTFTTNG